jgi:hypothetical protein
MKKSSALSKFAPLWALCQTLIFASQVFAAPRTQIKISDFVSALDARGELTPIIELAKAQLEAMVPDPRLREELIKRLEKAEAQKDWHKLDRFPVIPIDMVKTLRPALGGMGRESEKVMSEKFVGTFSEFIGSDCTQKAPLPKLVHPAMPGVTDGHFPNSTLGKCEVHQSFRLAKLLNSLALNEGSMVDLSGHIARTPEALFHALALSGHHLEMRNERTYANFLSLNSQENPIIWPVWIETGIKTKSGESLLVPVGHSHHAWQIRGPLINARITFYLGVSGVGFFAQVDERPAWTGLRAAYKISSASDEGLQKNLLAAKVASAYFRRIQTESNLYAKGMPADGYGFLGVCNDSNAVLELATVGTITTYPLMRASELDRKPLLNDNLDELIQKLPKDTERNERDRVDTLRRIHKMFPFSALDDPDLHDEILRVQMKEISEELDL